MRIQTEHLSHVFFPDTMLEKKALDDVSLTVEPGDFLALVGQTGSGKTTLALHLNGLLIPTSGAVRVGDITVTPETKKTGALTGRVGMVFQYPEHQLFEETVFDEIAFGLRHRGDTMSSGGRAIRKEQTSESIEAQVRRAAEQAGLDIELFGHRSPFSLSSGEQRKTAIASILALNPPVLIFDEPTQGLDIPSLKRAINHITSLNESGRTIIVITHDMEEILEAASRVAVMERGKIILDTTPRELFQDRDCLMTVRPFLPDVTELLLRLKERGWDIDPGEYRGDQALARVLPHIEIHEPTA
ncbi:MAG: energy-coupling factor transporter ATPase [Deltaproteobacteria bacterium]|nr:energy-coupling factor transporter ATPase [Candidatus Zymogenaceae bacterium]